jgi:KaiC domain protein
MNGGRVKIGIDGLDQMLGGGLIQGSISAIVGSYGTGKTTFALQFLWEGVTLGEKVIYISLEEGEERIFEYMAQKGWDFRNHLNKSLTVLKLDPSDFNLAISRVKNELPDLIMRLGATRVVIDPVSLFEDLFENGAVRRQEMFRFVTALREQQCSVIITSETDKNNPYISRHNLIEYLCDTVILLRYVRSNDLSEVHLVVEVVKMRLSHHSREIKPYEIQKEQIVVHSEVNVF